MKRKTGFFFDERCFWHSTGLHAVTLPVGGWVQPPPAAVMLNRQRPNGG
ncbi:histone deacetylase superfamily protein [Klebsiella pneumoniae subsp. pneumoniae KpMDU1]|uniref:Deacetylase n=1 Tax=Klebsiella pneumoniae TaxID=573 RepID=A0A377UYP1_KLEPN|nr:histone deacetylase superfamily protein [Klebsiella pneumoniae subsp. pneumoniae KpMDU1]STT01958.1 deacetylase [Klebsiella pneumoniae]